MNLYLRLLIVLVKALFSSKISTLAESTLHFRALPSDCDINLHVTNSRYLSFMDLGRTYLIGQLKLLQKLYKRRWGPVIQAAELTFLKPIMIGQHFTLVTRIVYWDDKYFYMEQRFEVNRQLYATATVRGLFINRADKIPTADIVALLENTDTVPVIPEFIKSWREMSAAKKNN